jgi:hypothetical protein
LITNIAIPALFVLFVSSVANVKTWLLSVFYLNFKIIWISIFYSLVVKVQLLLQIMLVVRRDRRYLDGLIICKEF